MRFKAVFTISIFKKQIIITIIIIMIIKLYLKINNKLINWNWNFINNNNFIKTILII